MKGYMGLACLAVSYSFCSSPPRYMLIKPNKQHAEQESTAYVFAHGLGANQHQARRLFKPSNKQSIICGHLGVFDFPDAQQHESDYNARYVNLGQSRDIERLSFACNKTLKHKETCKGLVLVGISRGSATALNYAALYKNAPIKAIVAEAPFDTLRSIVKHLLKRFGVGWVPFSESIGMKIAKTHFKDLKLHGLFPIEIAASIDKNLPILLVHSQKDSVIPVSSSRILYTTLRASGHNHVYLLEFPSGDHGKLMQSSYASLYQNVVHAFYKKYSLPHNADAAVRGESMLAQCQPSIKNIKARMKK